MSEESTALKQTEKEGEEKKEEKEGGEKLASCILYCFRVAVQALIQENVGLKTVSDMNIAGPLGCGGRRPVAVRLPVTSDWTQVAGQISSPDRLLSFQAWARKLKLAPLRMTGTVDQLYRHT